MATWTPQQLLAYEARNKSQSPKPKHAVQDEPVAEKTGENGDSGRVHVRVTSFRRRLCDPDNLCPKYFIDCLRYAGIIKDDTSKHISLEIRQERVEKKELERTEIEVTSGAQHPSLEPSLVK